MYQQIAFRLRMLLQKLDSLTHFCQFFLVKNDEFFKKKKEIVTIFNHKISFNFSVKVMRFT